MGITKTKSSKVRTEARANSKAPKPADTRGAPPKFPKIRPGLVLADSEHGIGVIVNIVNGVNGTDAYVMHGTGSVSCFDVDEMEEHLTEQRYDVGGFFEVVAEEIAGLFALHGSTAPFSPRQKSRTPVMPTSEGAALLAELLEVANLETESDWSSKDLIGELQSVRDKADRGIELVSGLWKIIATTGVEDDSQMPKEILARVGADYAELIAWREFAKRVSGFLSAGPEPYSDRRDPEVLEKRIYCTASELRARDVASIADKLTATDPYTTVAIKIDEIIVGSEEEMREWGHDNDVDDIFERAHALRRTLTELALKFWEPRKMKRAPDALSQS